MPLGKLKKLELNKLFMKNKYQYYQLEVSDKVFYAVDENNNIYFLKNYGWEPDYWQRATWKIRIELGKKYINDPKDTHQITEYFLKNAGVPLITPDKLKNQPPYEYYQDIRDEWLYYGRDEVGNVFIYKDPKTYYGKDKFPGKWEKIMEPGLQTYCKQSTLTLQKTDPRTEEYLLKEGIPLIKKDEGIEYTDYHL